MKLGKKVVIASAMLFLSHTAFAALLYGPNCVTPTSVKIEGRYYTQNITKAVLSAVVPGYQVDQFANIWDFEGYAFNCPPPPQPPTEPNTSPPPPPVQWVTFLMKGTNYFNSGNTSDHAVVITRANFTPPRYQGIGTIFAPKYNVSGEYFNKPPGETPEQGCQDVKSIFDPHSPTTFTFSTAACTNHIKPNDVPLADGKYYHVTIHAGGAGMGYVVRDTSTNTEVARGYIDSYRSSRVPNDPNDPNNELYFKDLAKNGAKPNLFANGGLSFWALWNNGIAQPGSSVEYSQIASGWF